MSHCQSLLDEGWALCGIPTSVPARGRREDESAWKDGRTIIWYHCPEDYDSSLWSCIEGQAGSDDTVRIGREFGMVTEGRTYPESD